MELALYLYPLGVLVALVAVTRIYRPSGVDEYVLAAAMALAWPVLALGFLAWAISFLHDLVKELSR